ncbi:hypothetical protein D3C71_2173140 [compost metagenome]
MVMSASRDALLGRANLNIMRMSSASVTLLSPKFFRWPSITSASTRSPGRLVRTCAHIIAK